MTDLPTLAEIDAALVHRQLGHRLTLRERTLDIQPIGYDKAASPLADNPDDLPELVRLAERLEPGLRRRFLDAVKAAQGQIDLNELANALMSAHYPEAEVQARLDVLEEQLGPAFTPVLRQGFLEGAQAAHVNLVASQIGVRFDLVNPLAVQWAERRAAELVVAITTSTRDAIRTLITDSVSGGDDVRRTARAIADIVGLDPRRASAVAAFQDRLEQQGAGGDILARRVSKYAQAQLRQRGTVIARTETLQSEAEGQRGLWASAKQQGLLDPETTRRVWIATMDDRIDEECEALDGETAELDGAFPGGYSGPPAHIQCRCAEGLVFER